MRKLKKKKMRPQKLGMLSNLDIKHFDKLTSFRFPMVIIMEKRGRRTPNLFIFQEVSGGNY